MPLFSEFYQRNVHNGRRTWNVEPSTSTIPPSPRERRKLAREKRQRGGRGRERGRRREREGMCRYIHILIEKRRERGWLSMRGVVAPPPPSNDQAETTFGVADPHTSFSTSILPPPRSFPIPRSSSQASHPSYPKNNCAFRGLLIRA